MRRTTQQVLPGVHSTPYAYAARLKLSRARIEANSGEFDPASGIRRSPGNLQQAFASLRLLRKTP